MSRREGSGQGQGQQAEGRQWAREKLAPGKRVGAAAASRAVESSAGCSRGPGLAGREARPEARTVQGPPLRLLGPKESEATLDLPRKRDLGWDHLHPLGLRLVPWIHQRAEKREDGLSPSFTSALGAVRSSGAPGPHAQTSGSECWRGARPRRAGGQEAGNQGG